MKSVFKWAFAIISMASFYLFNSLYIASHVIFNGNLKYDKDFISYDYVEIEELPSEITIWTYRSIAHKWLGVAKSKKTINV